MMQARFLRIALLSGFLAAPWAWVWAEIPAVVADAVTTQVVSTYATAPLYFEANRGQTDPAVRFLARGSGYGLYLTPTETVLTLARPTGQDASAAEEGGGVRAESTAIVRMRLVGANPRPAVMGEAALRGRVNYFIGDDPKQWRTNIPTFGGVRYPSVYPHIDLVYYGTPQQIEYDFIVAPGGDPGQILLSFGGGNDPPARIAANGDLILATQGGAVSIKKPILYQEIHGARVPVDGGYRLSPPQGEGGGASHVSFRVAAYDRGFPLVIDPVLVYATYLGGSQGDAGWAVAVDGAGATYVLGTTSSLDFPTASPSQKKQAGGTDVFISKINPAGSAQIYSTYLGGEGSDEGRSIAVDARGAAYVTGYTYSAQFPKVSPIHPFAGARDAFVAKINPAGSALTYSTYLGGSGSDYGYGIAVDATGAAYVTGQTASSDFPMASPFQKTRAGDSDAFVAKIHPSGWMPLYSTYLGGDGGDDGHGIAVDATGAAYVTGATRSENFPTVSALQKGSAGGTDLFVAKMRPSGSSIDYATYLGGSGEEVGAAIAVDVTGAAYVAGYTASSDFPIHLAPQETYAGVWDALIVKVHPTGRELLYATYLGGSGMDFGAGIAVDATGAAYVTGHTTSSDFPMVTPTQANAGQADIFVTKVNPVGSAWAYATTLGGSGNDWGTDIAVEDAGTAHVTGWSDSARFPTASPFQRQWMGKTDAVVVKIAGTPSTPPNDRDADGVADARDNCPTQANANQKDSDGDVIGDRCDPTPLGLCGGQPVTLRGTDGNDRLTGTPGRDVMDGAGGDDVIRGLGGNDLLCGGSGADLLFGGEGGDSLIGGPGRDYCDGGSPRFGDVASTCERHQRIP